MDKHKNIKINNINIAYQEYGKGKQVLLLHGIASSSYSWKYLLEEMPKEGFQYIMPDLKGFGYSDKTLDQQFSPFAQSEIISEFIKKKNIDDMILIAHSMGGAVALLSLFKKEIANRIDKLILIDSAGMFLKIPDFIADFAGSAEDMVILKYTKSKPYILPRYIFNELYFDTTKIKEEMIEKFAKIYSQPNAQACMIQSLQQLLIANFEDFYTRLQKLKIHTQIIWGENDSIIQLEDAFHFQNAIQNSQLKIIENCGHCPHEEFPQKTAQAIEKFINEIPLTDDEQQTEMSLEQKLKNTKKKKQTNNPMPVFPFRRAEMARLFKGNWNVPSVLFFIVLKILQFIRKLGVFARDNGWRKVTQVFLQKEHSKFCLASFKLKYYDDPFNIDDTERAKALIMAKLFNFIKNNSIFHWTLEHHQFSTDKKLSKYVDIVASIFNDQGELTNLKPNFDTKRETGIFISESQTTKLCLAFCTAYNTTLKINDKDRLKFLNKALFKHISSISNNKNEKKILQHYGQRMIQATFITFQQTHKNNIEYLSSERLATPDFRIIKHPGAGLLNIVCRFAPDLSEIDLWFQYHHVPVDGMPMQEMLDKLKKQWGSTGKLIFPPLDSKDAQPEIIDAGENIYRGRIFYDYSNIMTFRKFLNDNYYTKMIGPAPLPALLLWGLSKTKKFKGYKFTIPVDTAILNSPSSKTRNISLIFIKPDLHFDKTQEFNGLINYIKEFNHQIYLTRMGESESYELIEIAGMLSPLLTRIIHKLFPKPFASVIGNTGLTVIKNAEMFITPLTELQKSGFIAVGNGKIPTADGRFCGCISICGQKQLVQSYIKALNTINDDFSKMKK
jgi:pimeloyl-ACP methyl ester carboxylesterase